LEGRILRQTWGTHKFEGGLSDTNWFLSLEDVKNKIQICRREYNKNQTHMSYILGVHDS